MELVITTMAWALLGWQAIGVVSLALDQCEDGQGVRHRLWAEWVPCLLHSSAITAVVGRALGWW